MYWTLMLYKPVLVAADNSFIRTASDFHAVSISIIASETSSIPRCSQFISAVPKRTEACGESDTVSLLLPGAQIRLGLAEVCSSVSASVLSPAV